MRFRFCGDIDCPDWILSEIATLSKLSSIRNRTMVNQIISFLINGNFEYEKVLKLAADSYDGASDINGSVAAVHFIISSAAKYDVDDSSLFQEIQQLGLPKENSECIAKCYRENKNKLRIGFTAESFRISALSGTKFTVDKIKTENEDTNEPARHIAHLTFTIDNRPQDGSVSQQRLTRNGVDNSVVVEESSIDSTCRYQEINCALTTEKLDTLISELSRAELILRNIS